MARAECCYDAIESTPRKIELRIVGIMLEDLYDIARSLSGDYLNYLACIPCPYFLVRATPTESQDC